MLVLRAIGIRLVIHGPTPLPEGRTIFLVNHSSSLDFFILGALGLPNTRVFMKGAARRLPQMALMGWILGTFFTPTQAYPAKRAKLFQKAEDTLRRTGESVLLSPEGTRITTGLIGKFNKGAFHLATNLGWPMMPIFIRIPDAIDPGKGFVAMPGTVDVFVLEAIATLAWRLEDLEVNKEAVRDRYVAARAASFSPP